MLAKVLVDPVRDRLGLKLTDDERSMLAGKRSDAA